SIESLRIFGRRRPFAAIGRDFGVFLEPPPQLIAVHPQGARRPADVARVVGERFHDLFVAPRRRRFHRTRRPRRARLWLPPSPHPRGGPPRWARAAPHPPAPGETAARR